MAAEFFNVEHIQNALRLACIAAGGKKAFARAAGLNHTYVQDVHAGYAKPGPAIANALGYEKRVVYVKRENRGAKENVET